MNQFELFMLLEKAKTVPLEDAEIQELTETPEIQETMNYLGLISKPIDIDEKVKQIFKDLNKRYE